MTPKTVPTQINWIENFGLQLRNESFFWKIPLYFDFEKYVIYEQQARNKWTFKQNIEYLHPKRDLLSSSWKIAINFQNQKWNI